MMPDIIEDLLALSFIYQFDKNNECSVCGSVLETDGVCLVCEDQENVADLDERTEDIDDYNSENICATCGSDLGADNICFACGDEFAESDDENSDDEY